MISEQIRKAIVACYTEPQTAWEVATYINFKFIGAWNPGKLTGTAVERIWAAELKVNTPLRLLGVRPVHGFPPSDELTVVKRLVAA